MPLMLPSIQRLNLPTGPKYFATKACAVSKVIPSAVACATYRLLYQTRQLGFGFVDIDCMHDKPDRIKFS